MVSLRKYKPLHLVAADGDDINSMSSCLQDSVMKIGDFAYLPKQRRFACVANRFVWEVSVKRKGGPFARVRSGLYFDDVLSVKQQNIRHDASEAIVSLLAIRHEAGEASDFITLEFSGGGIIRMEVEAINAHLDDISEPWQTKNRPEHKV